MRDPAPSRGKARPAPQPRNSRPAADEGPRVLVNYYYKMRQQRTYPLRVRWQLPEGARSAETPPPVVVRPVIPGALVAPAEGKLEAGSQSEAVFYVTPVGRGTIRDARVDVVGPAGGPRAVTLPVRYVRQRLTKILLLLTFLVPAFVLYATKYNKLEGSVPVKIPVNLKADVAGREPPAVPRPEGAPPNRRGGGAAPVRPGGGGGAPVGGRRGGPPPGMQNPAMAPRGRTPAPQGPTEITKMIPGQPGDVLAYQIKRNMPDIPYFTAPVADGLGDAYTFLCRMSDTEPLAFYVACALLLLTGVSWFANMSSRARRRSQPFHFAPAAEERPAVKHAAVEDEPTLAEQVEED